MYSTVICRVFLVKSECDIPVFLTWYHRSRAQHTTYAARVNLAVRYLSGKQVRYMRSWERPDRRSCVRPELLLSPAGCAPPWSMLVELPPAHLSLTRAPVPVAPRTITALCHDVSKRSCVSPRTG